MDGHLIAPEPPTPLSGPPARGRVLVLAPHPDDETIGPGGTLVLHHRAGDEIGVLFVTSGVAGDPTGEEDPAAYAARRRREAEDAAPLLGVSRLWFWELPDGRRVHSNDVAALVPRLRAVLEEFAPQVVYAPHPLEQHGDHHACAVLLERALAAYSEPPPAFGYEVWSASQAQYVVDVSETYARKIEALRRYESQLAFTDIERHIRGLNGYRAVFLAKGAQWGEAFVRLSPDADAGRVA